MVCEDMRNIGLLGLPREHFIRWHIDETLNWSARLTDRKADMLTPNGVAASKIMADQMVIIDACLAPGRPRSGFKEGFAKAFEGAHFVHLSRHDRVRQAISRMVASQTKINHATAHKDDEHFAGNIVKGYDGSYGKDVEFRFENLHYQLAEIEMEHLMWADFFRTNDIVPQTLIYEDYADNARPALKEMAAAVGVTLPAKLPKRKLVRLSNEVNERLYKQFLEAGAEALINRRQKKTKPAWPAPA